MNVLTEIFCRTTEKSYISLIYSSTSHWLSTGMLQRWKCETYPVEGAESTKRGAVWECCTQGARWHLIQCWGGKEGFLEEVTPMWGLKLEGCPGKIKLGLGEWLGEHCENHQGWLLFGSQSNTNRPLFFWLRYVSEAWPKKAESGKSACMFSDPT